MEIIFARAGMLTTVQDLGCTGHRAAGVPLCGAMDTFALRLANVLVNNPENAAALELTLVGPDLVFSENALVAVTGASFENVASSHPFEVKAGQTLRFGAAVKGCRGYLAIAGKLKVPLVLGSFSTNLRDGFGGYNGRAFRDGERLHVDPAFKKISPRWRLSPSVLPPYSATPTVRVIGGAQTGEFSEAWLSAEFALSPLSDRMGLRLSGTPLTRQSQVELRSATVAPGTIQVPPDGQPIVLMADAQTIGGYPQLGHVISVDLPLLAQLRPGHATVRFEKISLEEAHRLLLVRETTLGLLRKGLAEKFS